MTKVSRIPVDKERMRDFIDDFWSAVASLENKEEARKFFADFLTPTEIKMFAKRFQVAILLLGGYNYQAIRNYVKVTDMTIAKINNWLAEGRVGLESIARRILTLKKKKVEKKENLVLFRRRTLGESLAKFAATEVFRAAKRYRKRKSLER